MNTVDCELRLEFLLLSSSGSVLGLLLNQSSLCLGNLLLDARPPRIKVIQPLLGSNLADVDGLDRLGKLALSELKSWEDALLFLKGFGHASEVVRDDSLDIGSELGDELLGEFVSLLVALLLERANLGIDGILVNNNGISK